MLAFALRTLALRRGRVAEPAAIADLQRRRLESLIGRVVATSPFYRDKYRGIDPKNFRLADLPPTNKAELMANFEGLITDPAVRRDDLVAFLDEPSNVDKLYLGKYIAGHTSGSQGQPMLLLQDKACVDLFYNLQMSRGNNEEVNLGVAIKRLLRPKRLAVVTLKRGFYPSATLFQHMPAKAKKFADVLWLSQTDRDVIDRLNAFKPDALTAYAGVLEILALEAEAGRLKLPALRQIVNNSEALTDKARARIEAAFGVHVMNNYATGECPFLSNGCYTDEGSHVNADWAILEVVDDQYRPVPDGTPGSRVLITNLANTLQPIIRYEVGDVVTMADTSCRCGSRLPRVARIAGRTADIFWVGEGPRRRQLLNIVLIHAFEHLMDVREWQAQQLSPTRILVRLEPLPGHDGQVNLARARHAIDRELKTYDFQDVQIDFEVVPHLHADPKTGKFRRMISLVGHPGSPSAIPAPLGLDLAPSEARAKV